MKQSIYDLFPEKIIISAHPARFVPRTPCWEWKVRGRNGYGRASYQGRNWGAHRLSYFISHGEIVSGMFVCHTCDNPPCVNPEHLFLGTNQENQADRIKWLTQLTRDEMTLIYNSVQPSNVLAKRFKLSVKQVEAIRPMRRFAQLWAEAKS